jgi:uncharacterized protein
MKFTNVFGEFTNWPLDPTWITEGTPTAASKLAARMPNGCLVRVWECSAGKFAWRYEDDEAIFVLKGECKVREPDDMLWWYCKPGAAVYFKRGSLVSWDVTEYVLLVRVTAPRVTLGMALRPLRYWLHEVWERIRRRTLRLWRLLT